MTEQKLIQNAQDYALRHQLRLAERLGFGIHGIIFVAGNNSNLGDTAIKAHRAVEPYLRERSVYERLKAAGVSEVLGFHVPQPIRFDDELRVIEMSIVVRPFVLDFAGAWLDIPPDFSDEVWAEWEDEKRGQFGSRWPKVQEILGALETLDIHMVDVSPSNIAFLDDSGAAST
jgi:serine kinase of HPr protein (carbohydrate metabolism regulator)